MLRPTSRTGTTTSPADSAASAAPDRDLPVDIAASVLSRLSPADCLSAREVSRAWAAAAARAEVVGAVLPPGQGALSDGRASTSALLEHVRTATNLRRGRAAVRVLPRPGCAYALAFSPSGQELATVGSNQFPALWDRGSGARQQNLVGHYLADILAVAFDASGKTLATGSGDRTVRLWDVASGARRHVLMGHSDAVAAVAFAPHGHALASGSHDGTVRVWDLTEISGDGIGASRLRSRLLMGGMTAIYAVAFSSDGVTLAVGASDHRVHLCDVATGVEWRTLEGHSAPISCLAFASNSNSRLLSGSWDTTLRLWDSASGATQQIFAGHADRVLSVALTPDGSTVASGSRDGTVRIWDARSGAVHTMIEDHDEAVAGVALSHDAHWLATASWDGSVRIYDFTARLPSEVASRGSRGLSWQPLALGLAASATMLVAVCRRGSAVARKAGRSGQGRF